jgi:hypothetical protein
MKKSFPVLLCVVLVIAGAGYSYSRENTAAVALSSDLIAQIHFVGGEQISSDTNSFKLVALANWPEATSFPCYGLRLSPSPLISAAP